MAMTMQSGNQEIGTVISLNLYC